MLLAFLLFSLFALVFSVCSLVVPSLSFWGKRGNKLEINPYISRLETMASVKLTDKIIRSLMPEQMKGDFIENLYIKANKAQNSFSWLYKFINPHNKKQRQKIILGRYPSMAADVARKIAMEYNAIVKQGIHPLEHKAEQQRQEEIKTITFKEITALYREYRADSVKNVDDAIRRVELYIFPKFGDMPLNKIVLAEWHRALKPMEIEKNNTLLKICSTSKQILDYAQACGYIEANPLFTLRNSFKKKKAKHQPTIPASKLSLFLRDLWLSNVERSTKHLIEFQLLTATRPNEAAKARWEEIDFNNGFWLLPAEKMKTAKPHKVALSRQALDLLREIKEFTGDHEYIFTSTRSRTGHQNTQTANNAIKTIKNGKYHSLLTSHGLRAIFSTYLNSLHDPMIQYTHVDACLAHAVGNGVSQSYNFSDYEEQKRYIMQRWGDFIEECKHP